LFLTLVVILEALILQMYLPVGFTDSANKNALNYYYLMNQLTWLSWRIFFLHSIAQ
jgi:hypothetical protein